MNERMAANVRCVKNPQSPERKASLLEDINTIKGSIEEMRTDFDNQIQEIILKIEEIENEKIEKSSVIDVKIAEQTTKTGAIFFIYSMGNA